MEISAWLIGPPNTSAVWAVARSCRLANSSSRSSSARPSESRRHQTSPQDSAQNPNPRRWSLRPSIWLGVPHPGRFTQEIVFRRCPACEERNVVKDGWFVCGLCGAELPEEWNFDQ